MKNIIVATDFTEHAKHAVNAAASIAKQTEAKLILLHVINRPLNSGDDSYENYHNMPGGRTTVRNIQNKLNEIVNLHNLKNVKTIYELRNNVYNTILDYADEYKAELIVMGAYGTTRSAGTFIGSNTSKVMSQAKIPVLIVQEKFSEFNIENMVLASEFYGEVYKVFPKMKQIIDLFDTKLHLLKVNTPNRFQRTHDSLKLMKEFSSRFDLNNYTLNIYNDLNIENGIINFTRLIHADLIAITPDGLWRLVDIFKKSTTDKLMKISVKAILSMKTRQPVITPTEIFYEKGYKHYIEED
ncbi:nucleotide-binding universal stress UspA family protein [Tenacibaculum skagerrakense]|uniref:Nucleotide-binding universal stress UspA family protein n=1 Tax=Tenacibaculum skagerrakense TaxID=186571 RepID=A0A4R2NQF0_9FLAO|nr:universal stress protein [Tenacibaculum skagerrakense]TCP23614.1 nucleotide-binding universal stress UspA family protein [Tenacibaculum skagerrakense]